MKMHIKKICPRPGSNWRPSDVNLVTKNVIMKGYETDVITN